MKEISVRLEMSDGARRLTVPPSARARRAPDRQSGRAGRGEQEGTDIEQEPLDDGRLIDRAVITRLLAAGQPV